MAQLPVQPKPGGTNTAFVVALCAFVITFAIALQLVFGLISISYVRSQDEASAASAALPTPAAPAAAPANTEPTISERVNNNLGGLLSRGGASFVLFIIVFIIALIALRFVRDDASGQGLGEFMGWGYIALATLLWMGGLWRFSSAATLGISEYLAYLVVGILMVVCGMTLAISIKRARMCRRFAIPLAIVAGLQVVLMLFRPGLRLDYAFALHIGFIILLIMMILMLIYASAIINALDEPQK